MRGLMKLGLLGLLVHGVRTLLKVGVVALAGYGVFQLYEQYAGDPLSGRDSDRTAPTYDNAQTLGDSGAQPERDAVTAAYV